jgi:hypothetical protein
MAGMALFDARREPQQFRQFTAMRVVIARQDVPDQRVRFRGRLARCVQRECASSASICSSGTARAAAASASGLPPPQQ